MPPTSTFHQESAGFWSVSWHNTSGEDGQRTISLRCRSAKNGDNSFRQPSGPSHALPLFIQGVMESLAWSICVRPPQLFVAPSPRSYDFTLLNKDHSPVWRRWAECSGFNLYRRRREHSPTPATHTCVRERAVPISAFHRISTAPPTTRHADADDTSQRRQELVHARRQREEQPTCTPRDTTALSIKQLLSPHESRFILNLSSPRSQLHTITQ